MWDWSTVRLLVAVFLIAAVVAICISPAVDLPETALRAKQDALRIAMGIIALATAMVGLLIPLTEIGWLASARDSLAPDLSLPDAVLPLLC